MKRTRILEKSDPAQILNGKNKMAAKPFKNQRFCLVTEEL
jgi:hypothetical protein